MAVVPFWQFCDLAIQRAKIEVIFLQIQLPCCLDSYFLVVLAFVTDLSSSYLMKRSCSPVCHGNSLVVCLTPLLLSQALHRMREYERRLVETRGAEVGGAHKLSDATSSSAQDLVSDADSVSDVPVSHVLQRRDPNTSTFAQIQNFSFVLGLDTTTQATRSVHRTTSLPGKCGSWEPVAEVWTFVWVGGGRRLIACGRQFNIALQ